MAVSKDIERSEPRLEPTDPAGRGRSRRPPRVRLWAIAVVVLATAGAFSFYRVADPPLSADEPHYLVYGRSLAEGWGLDLTRAYRAENYEPFYVGELQPHAQRFAGEDGRFATWHGIGLSALLAPALRLEPTVWAARLVMLLIFALLVYHVYQLVLRVSGTRYGATAIAVLMVALSPPLIFYSAQVFPEVPGALLVVISLRALVSERSRWIRFGGASTAAALLPWFNIRYVTLTAALLVTGVVVAVDRRRSVRSVVTALLPVTLPALVLGGLLIAFNLEVFGRIAPALEVAPVGYYFQPRFLYLWGIGGIIGVPNGLVPFAPVMLLALVAVPFAARAVGTLRLLAGALLAIVYVGFNAFFGSPGWAPPGRYFVSIVPLLAVPLALVVEARRRISRPALVILGSLTALSTVTATQHFQVLFERDQASSAHRCHKWALPVHVAGIPEIQHPD